MDIETLITGESLEDIDKIRAALAKAHEAEEELRELLPGFQKFIIEYDENEKDI